LDFLFQNCQPIAKNVMVVFSPGIAGDAAVSRSLGCAMAGIVVQAQRDDRATAGEDDLRVCAPRGVASHPRHACAIATKQPLLKTIKKIGGDRLIRRRRNPDCIETQRSSLVLDYIGERHVSKYFAGWSEHSSKSFQRPASGGYSRTER